MPEATTLFAFFIFCCSVTLHGKSLITYFNTELALTEVFVPVFSFAILEPYQTTNCVCGVPVGTPLLSSVICLADIPLMTLTISKINSEHIIYCSPN